MSLQNHTLTVEQAAAIIGISRGTAYEAARKGDLQVVRFGRRLVVPAAKLAALLGVDTMELASRAAALANDNSEPSNARAA